MANNYSSSSNLITTENAAQLKQLEEEILKLDIGFKTLLYEEGLVVYEDEGSNIAELAPVIAKWQVENNIKEETVLEECYFCNKPRPGEFGGSAILIYKGNIEYINPVAQAMVLLEKIKAKEN